MSNSTANESDHAKDDATVICPGSSNCHAFRTHADDDFAVPNRAYCDSDSSVTGNYHSPLPGGSSIHGSKYDLTKRVMRTSTKSHVPETPEVTDYGIHRIIRVHQKGGMGRILVAYDQFLKRDVAIKELHAEVAEDETVVRRFIGEAEITAQLEHPGIVPIHRLCQGSNGLPYYTMKMINGETLQDAIKAYHQNPTNNGLMNLVRRLVSVCKTISFAHSRGIIHRDLKPANVMLGEFGETLVMDWGLAKPFLTVSEEQLEGDFDSDSLDSQISPRVGRISRGDDGDDSELDLTTVGSVIGTPSFMSPEQANADEEIVGPVSDVFSLGSILYFLLAGRTAFYGCSALEVLEEVRVCNIVPPSKVKPNVPPPLEAVCLKAMQKRPEDRYQSANEFADDLCRWLDGEPVSAEQLTFWDNMRYRYRHYHVLSVCIPSVLALSLLFSGIGIWMFGGGAGADASTQRLMQIVDELPDERAREWILERLEEG